MNNFPYYSRKLNTGLFQQSARDMIAMLKEAENLINEISHSKTFANQLMSAAQQSQQKVVERLIYQKTPRFPPKISYSPDGMTLLFPKNQVHCCRMQFSLRWAQ